jgi:hypothetical protein
MKKYLFLDIDGVIGSHSDYYNRPRELKDFPYSAFDPECIGRVNEILDKTGVDLVISSSWRFHPDLKEIFRKVGLPMDFLTTSKNLDIVNDKRGDEIKVFLDSHPCDRYVIVDDDDFDILEEQKDNFVCVCGDEYGRPDLYKKNKGSGLTESLKELIINMLNSK